MGFVEGFTDFAVRLPADRAVRILRHGRGEVLARKSIERLQTRLRSLREVAELFPDRLGQLGGLCSLKDGIGIYLLGCGAFRSLEEEDVKLARDVGSARELQPLQRLHVGVMRRDCRLRIDTRLYVADATGIADARLVDWRQHVVLQSYRSRHFSFSFCFISAMLFCHFIPARWSCPQA